MNLAPRRIEGFDISNTMGNQSVASMVVWEDGQMKKADYRRFKIRPVDGSPDDYAALGEVLAREARVGHRNGVDPVLGRPARCGSGVCIQARAGVVAGGDDDHRSSRDLRGGKLALRDRDGVESRTELPTTAVRSRYAILTLKNPERFHSLADLATAGILNIEFADGVRMNLRED